MSRQIEYSADSIYTTLEVVFKDLLHGKSPNKVEVCGIDAMSVLTLDAIKQAATGAEVVNGDKVLYGMRLIKSPAGDPGLTESLAGLRPGLQSPAGSRSGGIDRDPGGWLWQRKPPSDGRSRADCLLRSSATGAPHRYRDRARQLRSGDPEGRDRHGMPWRSNTMGILPATNGLL